jgi:hypothetical protein
VGLVEASHRLGADKVNVDVIITLSVEGPVEITVEKKCRGITVKYERTRKET